MSNHPPRAAVLTTLNAKGLASQSFPITKVHEQCWPPKVSSETLSGLTENCTVQLPRCILPLHAPALTSQEPKAGTAARKHSIPSPARRTEVAGVVVASDDEDGLLRRVRVLPLGGGEGAHVRMTSLYASGMMRFSHQLVVLWLIRFATVALCLLWSVPYSFEYCRSTKHHPTDP